MPFRPHIPLPSRASAFVLAALLARGGLAAADTGDPADRVEAGGTGGVADPDAPGAGDRDWRGHVEDRLAALAAEPRARVAPPSRRTPASVRRVLSQAPAGARVALHVEDLTTGETRVDHRGERLMNPASNQKVLSAVAAVELLGPDYRFQTRVARHGDTLILIGEGDPTLQVDDLYALAARVAEVTDVETLQRIVVDDSAFDTARLAPGYDPDGPGVSYMAPSGALSMQFNTVDIHVTPGRYGGPARVQTRPANDHIVIDSTARTGRGRGLRITTHERDGKTVVKVRGSIAGGHAGVTKRRRIVDPGLYTGSTFADLLARITDTAPLPVERGESPDGATPLARRASAPLPRALESGLKFSNNFVAEQSLRTLAWRATGRPGNWDDGVEVLHRYLDALGLDAPGTTFENGSGMTQTGRLSPRTLVALVRRAQDLLPAMPIAGRDGTLRTRMGSVDGLVRAKTGTMGGVSALSGIAGQGENRIAFSILVNGAVSTRRARALQDRLVVALLEDAA